MTYLQAHRNLINAVRLVEAAFKRRDSREPGRKEKEDAEARLARLFRRAFRKQEEIIRAHLELNYWDRKSVKVQPELPDIDFDDEDMGDLIRELIKAIQGGISLFGIGKPAIDYTLTNAEAAKWARKYAYDLIKDITSTSMDVLRSVISAFVETPGMTIGDVISQLPFDGARAERIAVTEITRTYAEGEMMAGKELQKQFPDVRIIKIWFTNNDDRVCDICGPLDGMEVEIDEGFTTEDDKSLGISAPPAHVNCRCWMETSTALAKL